MEYFRHLKPELMTAQERELMCAEIERAISQKQPFVKVKTGKFKLTVKVETSNWRRYAERQG